MKPIFLAVCFAVLAVSLAQEADKADKVDTPIVAPKFPSFSRKFETSPTKRYFGTNYYNTQAPVTAYNPYSRSFDYEGRYDPHSYLRNDWKTVRLENKVDARGYHYTYETINGLLAEEVGQFENIGLKNAGTRVQGFVQLTTRDDIVHRIDYNTFYKGDNPALREPAGKTPPALAQLILILNAER